MNPLFYLQNGGLTVGDETTNTATEVAEEAVKSEGIIDVMLESWYIMGPLLVLSILAVYIFFERSMAISRALKEEKNFMPKIKDYVHDAKIESARNLCSTTDSPVARMLDKGLSRIGKPLTDITAAIENVGKLEIYSLEKNLTALATIAGAAPMIGFLGTVIGMVQVFYNMQTKGVVEIDDLAGGMKFAMITTIAGLIVGIIAYVAYNSLVARVSKVINKMEAGSIEFLDILEEPGK